MKHTKSLPTNRDNFHKFALMRSINKSISFISVGLSSITEIGIIYGFTFGMLSVIFPASISIYTAAVMAIIGTYVIEKNFTGSTKVVTRNLAYKNFGWQFLYAVLVFLLVTALSLSLSMRNSDQVPEALIPIVVEKTTDKDLEIKNNEIALIQSEYQEAKATKERSNKKAIASIKAAYQSKINIQYGIDNDFKVREISEDKVFRTQRAKAAREVRRLKAQRDAEIQNQELALSKSLDLLLSSKETSLSAVNASFLATKESIQSSNTQASNKRKSQVDRYSGLLKYGNLFFYIAFFISSLGSAINDKEAGITYSVELSQRDSGSGLWEEIKEKAKDKAYSLVKTRLDQIDIAPPAPTAQSVLYNINQGQQPIINIEYEIEGGEKIVIPVNLDEQAAKMGLTKDAKIKTNQIGFNNPPKKKNRDVNNPISNDSPTVSPTTIETVGEQQPNQAPPTVSSDPSNGVPKSAEIELPTDFVGNSLTISNDISNDFKTVGKPLETKEEKPLEKIFIIEDEKTVPYVNNEGKTIQVTFAQLEKKISAYPSKIKKSKKNIKNSKVESTKAKFRKTLARQEKKHNELLSLLAEFDD